MERFALSWGSHATVVRPKALTTRIYRTASELKNRYGDVVE